MADNDVKSITAMTGSFAALRLPSDARAAGGKAEPAAGKAMPEQEPERQDMELLASRSNVASQTIGRDLRFQVDMNTGRSVIQVLDRETGEIIRQIPPENAKTYVSSSGAVVLRLFDERI